MPENPASYRVVRTKSYLFNKADGVQASENTSVGFITMTLISYLALLPQFVNMNLFVTQGDFYGY
ncbi:hypothetical protein DB351_00940 [Klebsiella pneumoniae]|nr:hypothetical protein DB351_00940 [Klebsiella pneumoniae]